MKSRQRNKTTYYKVMETKKYQVGSIILINFFSLKSATFMGIVLGHLETISSKLESFVDSNILNELTPKMK